MRLILVRIISLVFTAASIAAIAGCGGAGTDIQTQTQADNSDLIIESPSLAGDTQAEEPDSPLGDGSTLSQSVGSSLDGLQLLDIRWSDHGTFFRVVFDIGNADGEPLLQTPHANASMPVDGKRVEVLLGGIRSISDNPNASASELAINDSLVLSIERVPSYDDQALLYHIDLLNSSTYALSGLSSPGRIVVDIIKS